MLEDKTEKQKLCNFRDKSLVDGNCLLTNVIYKAAMVTLENIKQYLRS